MRVRNTAGRHYYFSFGRTGINLENNEEVTLSRVDEAVLANITRYAADGLMTVVTAPTVFTSGTGDPSGTPAGGHGTIYINALNGSRWRWDKQKGWGQISGAVAGWASGNLSGAGSPVTEDVTPLYVGQIYRDTVTDDVYTSTGMTSADWVLTDKEPVNVTSAGSPVGVNTPDFIGQYCQDTESGDIYRSTGMLNTEWERVLQDAKFSWFPEALNLVEHIGFATPAGGMGSISRFGINAVECLSAITIENAPFLTDLDFPNLTTSGAITLTCAELLNLNLANLLDAQGALTFTTPKLSSCSIPLLATASSIDITNTALAALPLGALTEVGGDLILTANTHLLGTSMTSLTTVTGDLKMDLCTALTSLSLPELVTVTGDFTVAGNTAMTSLSLPELVTAASGIAANGCTLLTTLDVAKLVPTTTKNYNFSACALNQASVDLLLARCVANAEYVAGTITLNGGTNAVPSAQGTTDAGVLTGRGVIVLVNA